MSTKRPRTRGGASISATTPSTTHPLNQFSTQHHQERYDVLSKLPIKANKYYILEDLRILGIGDEVQRLAHGIKWDRFLDIKETTIRELLLEFLSTFIFHKSRTDYDREDTIKFKLGGFLSTKSISEFSVHYGFYEEEFSEEDRYITSYFQLHETQIFPRQLW